MDSFKANVINSLSLMFIGLWGYFEVVSPTALIPVIFGVILLLCTNGLKKQNKLIAHIAVLLTLVILIALIVMRLPKSLDSGGVGLIRVVIMILTSIFSMVYFVKSFIANRKKQIKNQIMKYIYLLFSVLTVVSCMNNKQPEVKVIEVPATKTAEIIKSDVSFGVRGNCGMCKSTIESATMSIEGVDTATWSTESKMISINVSTEINDQLINDIHNAIAKSGYDTELSTAVDEDYDKLPMCCKYDREMVIASNDTE